MIKPPLRHLFLRLLLLTTLGAGLVIISAGCKTFEAHRDTLNNQTTLKALATKNFRILLAASPVKKDYVFVKICNNIHNTCTNAYRTSPSATKPQGSAPSFKIAQWETARDEILEDSEDEVEIKLITKKLVEMENELKSYQEDKEQALIKQIKDQHDSADNFDDHELLPFIGTKNVAKLEKIHEKRKRNRDFLAPKTIGIAVVASFLAMSVQMGKRLVLIPTLMSGAWYIYRMSEEESYETHTNSLWRNALKKREEHYLELVPSKIEEAYGDIISEKQQNIDQEKLKTADEVAVLEERVAQKEESYHLLFDYIDTIASSRDTVIDEDQELIIYLMQLAALFEGVIREDLQERGATEILNKHKNKPILAKTCLPGEQVNNSLKLSCYPLKHYKVGG
ncbi:MAG: hypothetical protein OXC40_01965 [Proteobacteria bacterium]|nr:hypothetical protein [Pseudomonadota bacterium]